MKRGKNSINSIGLTDKDKILNYIIDDCVWYADDSYENFARQVIQTLKTYELIDYGEEE